MAVFGDIIKCLQDIYGTWHEIVDEKARKSLENKVDKEEGKVLSSNDYTDGEKNKLKDIEAGANKTIIDKKLDTISQNTVANYVVAQAVEDINTALGDKVGKDELPKIDSELKESSGNAVENRAIYQVFSKHIGEKLFAANKEVTYTFTCIYAFERNTPLGDAPDEGTTWGTFVCEPEVYWDDFTRELIEQQATFTIEGKYPTYLPVTKYDPEKHTPEYTQTDGEACVDEMGRLKYLYIKNNYNEIHISEGDEESVTLKISRYTHPDATQTTSGFLCGEDKKKIDDVVTDVFKTATAAAEGKKGYVPAPPKGSDTNERLMTSAGSWTGSIGTFNFDNLNIAGDKFADENGLAAAIVRKFSPLQRAVLGGSDYTLRNDHYLTLATYTIDDITQDNSYRSGEITVHMWLDPGNVWWQRPFRFTFDGVHVYNPANSIREIHQTNIILHKPSTSFEHNGMHVDKIVLMRKQATGNRYDYYLFAHMNFDGAKTGLLHWLRVNVLNYTCSDVADMNSDTISARTGITDDVTGYEIVYTYNISFE